MNIFDSAADRPPMVAAHRGFRSIRPENTLSAFAASLGHCHYIELDVQVSSDGVAIVHHDDILGRTSNGSPVRLDTQTLAELKQLDFGSWFLSADPFKTLKNRQVSEEEIKRDLPQRILTLKELLQWRNEAGIPLNIEIKDQQGGRFDERIVDLVLNEIKAADCDDQLIVSSFNHTYLRQIKERYPNLALGALQEGENPPELVSYLKQLGAAAYHPDQDLVSAELIKELRGNNIDVNIYTVNDVQKQKEFLQRGATSVITDFPDLSILTGLV